jgi:hypothetical protein
MTHRAQHRGSAGRIAGGLGWFSIGLGLLEVGAAGTLARGLGLRGQETLLRAFGVREIVNGIGLLAAADRRPWVQARIAGDALDAATLFALARRSSQPAGVAVGLAAVLGVTVIDLLCAEALRAEEAGRAAQRRAMRDYASRSGFPIGTTSARGAARGFTPPDDFRIPEALRPWAAA